MPAGAPLHTLGHSLGVVPARLPQQVRARGVLEGPEAVPGLVHEFLEAEVDACLEPWHHRVNNLLWLLTLLCLLGRGGGSGRGRRRKALATAYCRTVHFRAVRDLGQSPTAACAQLHQSALALRDAQAAVWATLPARGGRRLAVRGLDQDLELDLACIGRQRNGLRSPIRVHLRRCQARHRLPRVPGSDLGRGADDEDRLAGLGRNALDLEGQGASAAHGYAVETQPKA
mmetsp:Transcript_132937/g.425477  ORF Transcript_132937/g.425477 Transcript_132937/m.425477 type:complete len:229 (+) Transcript_132937:1875-2561(+)